MHTSFVTVALLSLSGVLAAEEKRQATDAGQFTSAAEQLISKYIPATALVPLEAAIQSAASAASVTGDPQSLLYSGLAAASAPGWFASAIPSAYSSQIAALGSDISSLRGSSGATAGAGAGGSGSGTVTTTTTSTASGSGSPTGGNAAGGVYSGLTTQVISGVTSVYSTALTKASGAGSTAVSGASSVGSAGVSGASSVGSAGASKASSAGSAAASGASGAASSASSKAGVAMPTAVKGAAAGVAGLIGLMAAL